MIKSTATNGNDQIQKSADDMRLTDCWIQ